MDGEVFLDKLYRDLHKSEIVNHTALISDDKYVKIKKYLDRLDRVHKRATSKHKKELLKWFYYDKYVIKKENISNKFADWEKEKIIKEQQESLEEWIDYLSDETTDYPMWAKYWVFQGMLKIGTYDEANGTYGKRSKKTIAPFVKANPEIIAKCIEMIKSYIDCENIEDEEVFGLVERGSFAKLYTKISGEVKNKIIIKSDKNDGIWIRYNQQILGEVIEDDGYIPEYLRLSNSLRDYDTGWCVAVSETAKNHVREGDFYIYYTKDSSGEYRVPRVAIKLEGHDRIAEIRGVAESQNLEAGLEDIVKKKLEEMSFLYDQDVQKCMNILDNMKMLTLINKKNARKEELTEQEIIFIYELKEEIVGFGWQKDKRVYKIRLSRNRNEDYKKIVDEDVKVAFLVLYPSIIEDLKIGDSNLLFKVLQNDPSIIAYVDHFVPNYSEIAVIAIGLQHNLCLGLYDYLSEEDKSKVKSIYDEELKKVKNSNSIFVSGGKGK